MAVIGAPVRAGKISTLIRTYVFQYKDRFKSAAFFCAAGPGQSGNSSEEMTNICVKKPLALLEIRTQEVDESRYTIARSRNS